MFADDNALIHTRTASQVCQNWRSLLLAMPSLWGKLLDFDFLAQSTGDGYWGEELVKRTGNESILWIKRQNPQTNREPIEPLALHLAKTVEDNFHRRLQISVVNLELAEYVYHHVSWSKIGSLPAPQLQCFDLSVTSKQLDGSRSTYQGHFSSPATFADNAPCLRKFRAAEFAFNLQASWLRGLRDLCISHYPPLSVTLDALATIECLEYLRLSAISFTEDDEADDDEDLRTVHLSKLKELHLGSFHPSNCDVLLDHLIIPQDCVLQYSLGLSSDWLYEDGFGTELTDLICRLSKCAQGYFLHHIPTKVWFCYEYELIGITTQAQDKSRGFHFEIKSRYLDRLEKLKPLSLRNSHYLNLTMSRSLGSKQNPLKMTKMFRYYLF